MKKLLFVASALAALSLLAPSSGFAQMADNQVGIYFDLDATVVENAPTSTVPFNAYLIITQPVDNFGADVTMVEGFECMISFSNGAAVFKLGETLPPNTVNIGDATNPANGLDYAAGFGTPIPVVNGMVSVLTLQLMVIAVEENFIYVQNSSLGNMYYGEADGETLVDFYPSSGDQANPCAAIAGTGTVTATESDTWGGVKALYR